MLLRLNSTARPCLYVIIVCFISPFRVAKFTCPRVHNDQKMSENNQKLRSGCPPDYQIFWGKYFENNCPYKFFKDFILTLSFSNKHISFWELKTNCISYEGKQIYVEDNQISNFGCPLTTNFRFEFCYPAINY